MSSYQLDPQYDASKVLYINSKDATTYLEVNAQGTDYLHTNFLYSLTEKLNIAGDQMALLSLYSATIPHSFFNVREGVNDVVPMRLNMIDGNNDAISGQFDLKLDDGNYDTDSLIRQFYYGNVDFQTAEYIGFKEIIIVGTDSGGNGFSNPITDFIKDSDPFTGENPFLSFNQINNCFRFKMEYNDGAPNVVAGDVKVRSLQITFNWGTAPITPTFAGGYDLSGTTNHMANALLGFRGNSDYPTLANQVEPATGNLFYVSETIPPAPLIHTRCVLQSQIVIDLNDNIHGLMLRTNLVSKGSLSSHTSIFSNILARIPISTLASRLETTTSQTQNQHGSAQQGGMIYFNPSQATHQNLVDLSAIDVLGIRLTDDKDRTIDLNGLDFQIAILLQYVGMATPPKTPSRKEIDEALNNKKENIKNKPTTKTSKK